MRTSFIQKLLCEHRVGRLGLQMTQRTFDDGRPWPPLKADTLRLYSMRFCPYAQRARLVLIHKNIPHETINVHLKRKPSWLFERNPKGRVPVLEHPDGRIVYESLVVCEYLDDIYPQHPLTPTDPFRRARDRLLPGYCEKFMRALYQLLFTEGTSEEAKATYQKGFRVYETELIKRLPEGPFFGGSKPAMGDYMVWPWLERVPMVNDEESSKTTTSITDENRLNVSCVRASQFPHLYRWMEAMYTLPAVKATMFDSESHQRFFRSMLTADPEYDVGLENEPPLPAPAKL